MALETDWKIGDLDGMIGLIQAGVLEIHPWGSSMAALERPDMIIMDLDPAAMPLPTDGRRQRRAS